MVDLYQCIHCPSGKHTFLKRYPHCAMSGFNVHKEVELPNDEQFSTLRFPYSCMQPLPFLPPEKISSKVLEGDDPILDVVKKKAFWNYQVNIMDGRFTRTKKTRVFSEFLQNIISSKKKCKEIPRDYAKYIQLISANPDKEFEGVYNWYYSGGSLDQLELENQVMMLTVRGKNKDKLAVIPIKRREYYQPVLSAIHAVQPTYGYPIHQVCGVVKQHKGLIGVRLRNECHVYTLTEDMKLKSVHKTTSECPFTGLDVSRHAVGKYCTITTDRYVKEWDINTNTYISSSGISEDYTSEDKWCTVSYSNDTHTIMMTDRCCTHFLDKREKLKSANLVICPTKKLGLLENCEVISLAFQSEMLPTNVYVCSSHHVLLYDIRSASKPIQRWAHHMQSPPLYGSAISPEDGKEVLCIANQGPGEIVSIFNSCDGKEPYCQVSPFAPPNLHDALLSAQRCGLWLHPFTQQHLKMSLTGLTWLPRVASELTFLSHTSAGDVFHHIMKSRHFLQSDRRNYNIGFETNNGYQNSIRNDNADIVKDYSKTSDMKCLANWEKQLLKRRSSTTLKATTWKNMDYIHRILGAYSNKSKIKRVLKPKGKWKMSKKDMESCVDILAPRILGIWDIEDEPEWYNDKELLQKQNSSLTCLDKVEAWLANADNEKNNLHENVPLKQVPDNKIVDNQNARISDRHNVQTRSKDVQKFSHFEFQNTDSYSKTKFTTSTPINSHFNRDEITTQDISQIMDPLMDDDDILSQDIFMTQNENTLDKLALLCANKSASKRPITQEVHDDDCLMVSETVVAKRKKIIPLCKKKEYILGF